MAVDGVKLPSHLSAKVPPATGFQGPLGLLFAFLGIGGLKVDLLDLGKSPVVHHSVDYKCHPCKQNV